ncbi:MAG: FAD-dependent oxidoreductase [Hyphomicrobiaceae bacterium]
MPRDSRFDVLFEPVRLGPVTAPNRFYQVPHCSGMGYQWPATLAAMREVKAEGGWGVVNTEYCSVAPTSDDTPYPHCALWDAGDVRNMAAMADAVHRHGALAGVELWHGGLRSANFHTRETAIGPVSLPTATAPWQAKAMDAADIRAYRASHKAAVGRALEAGFDIVYVYAAHTYLLAQFLDPGINQRNDAYGGSLENRLRLVREVAEEAQEVVRGKAAVAIRIEVNDEVRTDAAAEAERREMLALLAPHVDLFDVTITDYTQEMGVSRFVKEASLEPFIAHVRAATGRPVVSVGRFTSPETMLSQVRRGIVDLVGAARPSIADPFLPAKVRDGRLDDIRECIGCNICYACDGLGVPIRCTQNPTMGEEWRRGWHPERVNVVESRAKVLVVGGGPAGLEAAHLAGKRGFEVTLAEASGELGGRVLKECRLPGLAEWRRVADYRIGQLGKLANVEVYRGSAMTAADVRGFGASHVLIATGSRWRGDGRGRTHRAAVPSFSDPRVMTPDDILAGRRPVGPVVVFDDDLYVTAALIAELLATEGLQVTYVTTAGMVSSWTGYTAEQARGQARLIEMGVEIVVGQSVLALEAGGARLSCIYTSREHVIPCSGLVTVTSREPEAALWHALAADPAANGDAGFATLQPIGDGKAPGLIAHAIYDGHKAARALEEDGPLPGRERVVVG